MLSISYFSTRTSGTQGPVSRSLANLRHQKRPWLSEAVNLTRCFFVLRLENLFVLRLDLKDAKDDFQTAPESCSILLLRFCKFIFN